MKKISLLAVLLLAALQVTAADVNVTSARDAATRFLRSQTTVGRHAAPAANSDVKLVHVEANAANAGQAVYYIFNTEDSYVIISGDDRAEEVLAYGDSPMDMNYLPDGMKYWLDCYKMEIEYLQAHPGLQTANTAKRAPSRQSQNVEPLLTAMWDQSYPYYNRCPMYNGARCLTGCPATSLTMVFYYWKYPTEPTPTVRGYVTSSLHLSLEDLAPITLDWDNMLDRYRGGFDNRQADAVAWLMRYVGQAERMDYGPDGSGSYGENILETVKDFGYDEDASLVYKTRWNGSEVYDNTEWADMIQDELYAGRPIVYCGYSTGGMGGYAGHAFNVDGYDAVNDKYHINWGWGGSSNGYCALNAFKGGSYTFNIVQQMIIGIEPPATVPTIKVKSSRVRMSALVEKTSTATFSIKGALLTDGVTLTLNDPDGMFSLNKDHIALSELNSRRPINVTYAPTASGNHTATVTLSSPGARDVTVTIYGTAVLETYDPVMTSATNNDNTSCDVQWQDLTPAHNVSSYRLEVAPVPFHESRMTQAFDSEYEGSNTVDFSSRLDEITSAEGWTGNKVYRGNGYLILGSATKKGWITTPALDMRGNEGLVTVKVKAKCTSAELAVPMKISTGEGDTTIILSGEEEQHVVLLPCTPSETAHVTVSNSISGKRVLLSGIEVLAGDDYTTVDLSRATYFDHITDLSYQVSGMAPGYYAMRVQAVYTDGTISQWSNRLFVQLSWTRGDVNRDGEVNIADVNSLISYVMNDTVDVAPSFTDVNGDGEVNIADINAIIDMILERQ